MWPMDCEIVLVVGVRKLLVLHCIDCALIVQHALYGYIAVIILQY